MSYPPALSDVGVIGLVPDRWHNLWQPRHNVLRRLAAFFHVVWVNPTPSWREPLRRDLPSPSGEGWAVIDAPPYLPAVHRPAWLRTLLRRARVRQARQELRRRGARHIVLYVWRPAFADALETPHDFSVYHIDDDYGFNEACVGLSPHEANTIRRVDQVIIHSPRLMELKGGINPRTAEVPNGVDYAAFSTPVPVPADLAAIPRPWIGYAGWIKPQLDWALLDAVAAGSPEMSFVFVGQTKLRDRIAGDPAYRSLTGRPNVYFLGLKMPEELAAYPQHFDVCTMPYRLNAYTDCIYPLKLHEYLASGRPVVGTPIYSLQGFRDAVSLASGPEAWREALAQGLTPEANSDDARRRRQAIARDHEWWRLTGRVAELIAAGLEHPGVDQIAARVAACMRE